MKKTISLFLMAFLVFGALGFVTASDDNTVPAPARIGFFENLGNHLGLAFTFNKEKKIEKTLDIAEKRLAEAELLSGNDSEAYKKAQERYEKLTASAENILANMKSDNENVNSSELYLEKMARIQDKFERHRDHVDEIYARALNRFEANNASEEKIERFGNFYERALNRTDAMEERALKKRQIALQKHKVLTEMTDEELDSLLSRIEKNEGLTQARAARIVKEKARAEKVQELGLKRMERVKTHLNDSNLTEEQKNMIQARLGQMENRIDDFGERAQARLETRKEVGQAVGEKLKTAIKTEIASRNGNSD